MLFQHLNASPALSLEQYADVDHFRESERYVGAQSVPVTTTNVSIVRAVLRLPSCTVSLVRTFPRIITGYDLFGRMLVVIPMDSIASARVNGDALGQSLLVVKDHADCTIYEPEGRLVAVVSLATQHLDWPAFEFQAGYRITRISAAERSALQGLLFNLLQAAATEPVATAAEDIERALLAALDKAFCTSEAEASDNLSNHYKALVDRIDELIRLDPIVELSCDRLARELGVSVRTVQTATNLLCGSGAHHYARLRRLWSVRQQLRGGAPGLTVRASALAHGFWHMGEFSRTYRTAFGELPSRTLGLSRSAAA